MADQTRNTRPDPVLIEAAGGLVVRPGDPEHDILLIFRRGVWDLPKGKIDADETPAGCALREVEEETGAVGLRILRGAGMTVHKYVEHGRDVVKTTWWFLMTTESEKFVPDEREQIEDVRWIPFTEARTMVGYPNLKKHLEAVTGLVRTLFPTNEET